MHSIHSPGVRFPLHRETSPGGQKAVGSNPQAIWHCTSWGSPGSPAVHEGSPPAGHVHVHGAHWVPGHTDAGEGRVASSKSEP